MTNGGFALNGEIIMPIMWKS
jgi:antitoxin HigA-1